jgi:outer membrane receptor protein involved in Fe transport
MTRRAILICHVLGLACVLLAGNLARADSLADEAEVNFRLGTERYQAADYRSALAYFLASNRLAPNRNVRFNIARAFQMLKQFPEAHRFCLAALEGDVPDALRAPLEQTLRAIEQEVGVLDVQTDPPGATVYVDREDLGSVATSPSRIAVSEGEHRVIARLPGYRTARSEIVSVERGKSHAITLELVRIVGEVEVRAPASAEVRIDRDAGEAACSAPCVLELSPGPHTLHLRREGFRIESKQVFIEPFTRTSVVATETPLTSVLVVTADENDALIEVDGVAMGFTPAVVHDVPVGKRRVRLSLRGFESIERTVFVREGVDTALRGVQLIPVREVTAAARVSQTIDDAPASVSVITHGELEAFGYPTIYEALRGQRGIALTNDGAYAGVSLRGLGQPGDYGNRLLVLSDGATLNDDILWQSYVDYAGRVDLHGIERIELVRGPGSVLYGTGAVSGVVNLVPIETPPERSLTARVSAVDPRTARARLSAALPWGTRKGLTLGLSGAHGDGQRVRLAQLGRSVSGVGRFDAATGEARLRYEAFTLQAFVTHRDQRIPQGAYGGIAGDQRNRIRDSRGLFELRMEPQLSEKLTLYARAFANVYRYAAKNLYQSGATTSFVAERYRGDWFGAEARFVLRVSDALRITAGSELQANVVASLRGEKTERNVTERYLAENEPYQTYAGYGLIEWEAQKALTVSLGARVDAWSTFGATANPRVALIARATRNDVLKAMAGRAFRAPSIYELRYSDGGTTQVPSNAFGRELGPELVWSAELEHTHMFEDGWSLLEAVHFQRAEDLIEQAATIDEDELSPVIYRNAAHAVRTLGGDLELKRELRAGWLVAASYGYLNARFVGAKRTEGLRVFNTPEHYASVRGIAPLATRVRLAARATLEAPRRLEPRASAQSRPNADLMTEPAVIADVVLSGEILKSGLDYAVGLYNVFDWRYALPTDRTFLTNTMPQPSRTLLLSLGVRTDSWF